MTRGQAIEIVGELFEVWYSSLVRYASRQSQSVAQAEDVVQEAFLSLFRHLTSGGTLDNPKAWLLCVVRRELIKLYRADQRHGGPLQALGDDLESSVPPRDRPPDLPPDELARLYASLSQREEEVILLRVKGLKYREIAKALDVSTGSVKTLISRAIGKMQACMSQQHKETRGRHEISD